MEPGLYSFAAPTRRSVRACLITLTALGAFPLSAQDDTAATNTPASVPTSAPPVAPRFNLMVSVQRDNPNQVQLQECRDKIDAGTITGEIVVCGKVGSEDNGLTNTRKEAQKRYAQETMVRGAPRTPDFFIDCQEQGYPIGCVAFGKVVTPAYVVDFGALPMAPAGSDADRIARGLPPLGQGGKLFEDEE